MLKWLWWKTTVPQRFILRSRKRVTFFSQDRAHTLSPRDYQCAIQSLTATVFQTCCIKWLFYLTPFPWTNVRCSNYFLSHSRADNLQTFLGFYKMAWHSRNFLFRFLTVRVVRHSEPVWNESDRHLIIKKKSLQEVSLLFFNFRCCA